MPSFLKMFFTWDLTFPILFWQTDWITKYSRKYAHTCSLTDLLTHSLTNHTNYLMPSGTYESLKDFFFASYVTFYLLLAILHIIEKILFSMLEEVKLPIRLLGEDRKIKKPAKIMFAPKTDELTDGQKYWLRKKCLKSSSSCSKKKKNVKLN